MEKGCGISAAFLDSFRNYEFTSVELSHPGRNPFGCRFFDLPEKNKLQYLAGAGRKIDSRSLFAMAVLI